MFSLGIVMPLPFSYLLLVIVQDEWRYLIAGGISKAADIPNPSPDWISSRIWGDVLSLSAVEKFEPIVHTFSENVEGYKVSSLCFAAHFVFLRI